MNKKLTKIGISWIGPVQWKEVLLEQEHLTQCLPCYIRIGQLVNQQKDNGFASNNVIVQNALIIILVMSKHETVVH